MMSLGYFTKMRKKILAVLLVLLVSVKGVSAAGIVPTTCTGADCGFSDLIILAQNVINFLIFNLAMPLAAIAFAVAGFKLMFAKGNPAKIQEAKTIFWYVLVGIIIALAAWLTVEAVLVGLGLKAPFWLLTP